MYYIVRLVWGEVSFVVRRNDLRLYLNLNISFNLHNIIFHSGGGGGKIPSGQILSPETKFQKLSSYFVKLIRLIRVKITCMHSSRISDVLSDREMPLNGSWIKSYFIVGSDTTGQRHYMLSRRHNNLIKLLTADELKNNHFMTFQPICGNSETKNKKVKTICFIQKAEFIFRENKAHCFKCCSRLPADYAYGRVSSVNFSTFPHKDYK